MAKINPDILVRERFNVRLDFTSPVLGSQPSDSIALAHVRQRSIDRHTAILRREQGMPEAKARVEAERIVNETMAGMSGEESDESAVKPTVFHADSAGLHMYDYQIRGAFREAAKALDLKVPGKKAAEIASNQFMTRNFFIRPLDRKHGRKIYFMRDGEFITEPDDILERPKRVQVPHIGEMSTIGISEMINPPASLYFTVDLIAGSKLTRKHVEQTLAYFGYMGLGQWRTGGWGTVEAELTAVKEVADEDLEDAA